MKNWILSTTLGRIAAATIVAVGLIGGVAVVANASSTASDCTNLMYPLCPRSVAKTQVVDGSLDGQEVRDGGLTGNDLADGSVPASKIAPADRSAFLADTDVNGTSTLKAVYNNVTIENTGGSWVTRKTSLGSFTLPAGTWMISTSAQVQRTVIDETDPQFQTRPQIAVRAFATEANPFGLNFGTVMSTIAPYVGADMFGSDSRRVQLSAETTFTVSAFGYQDNRGSDDSGKLKVVNATIFVQQG